MEWVKGMGKGEWVKGMESALRLSLFVRLGRGGPGGPRPRASLRAHSGRDSLRIGSGLVLTLRTFNKTSSPRNREPIALRSGSPVISHAVQC
jgi:hypothetical protein